MVREVGNQERQSIGDGALLAEVHSVLYTEEQISGRVRELAAAIDRDYARRNGRELYLVGILKGAAVFTADLMRCLKTPVQLDFMAVSSYGSASETSGVVRIIKDLDESIEGRDVLLVEDIVDSGLTLHYLKQNLQARGPRSLRICALLDKPSRRRVQVQVDYVGFTVPDLFIVGYGLDYAGRYRQLPFIATLKPSAD